MQWIHFRSPSDILHYIQLLCFWIYYAVARNDIKVVLLLLLLFSGAAHAPIIRGPVNKATPFIISSRSRSTAQKNESFGTQKDKVYLCTGCILLAIHNSPPQSQTHLDKLWRQQYCNFLNIRRTMNKLHVFNVNIL